MSEAVRGRMRDRLDLVVDGRSLLSLMNLMVSQRRRASPIRNLVVCRVV